MEKTTIRIVIGAVLLAIGFFIGRCQDEVEVVRYIKGETIRDTVNVPYPVYTQIPAKPNLPTKPDTIWVDSIQVITEKVDTATIIHDYILQKTYAFNVFNNANGKLDVEQIIGYNKLLSFDYEFTPIHKETTIRKAPRFTPFVTAGYSTNQSALVGGGIYVKKLGVEYNYNWRQTEASYHTLKLNYKF